MVSSTLRTTQAASVAAVNALIYPTGQPSSKVFRDDFSRLNGRASQEAVRCFGIWRQCEANKAQLVSSHSGCTKTQTLVLEQANGGHNKKKSCSMPEL